MLNISNLTYRIGGRLLIDNASASIPMGAKVGLFGRNGAGKTTLFKMILGDLEAEAGSIDYPSRMRVGTVAQEAPGSDVTLLQTVIAGHRELAELLHEAETVTDGERLSEVHMRIAALDGYSAEAKAAGILSGLGFDTEAQRRPCSSFSGGWRMRVALASLLFSEPDFMLLDEPTNYLDLEGVLWLESFLKDYRHTVVVISHDRDLLDRCMGAILHLDQGKLTLYTGNYQSFVERLTANRQRLESESRKVDAARKHMQSFVDRFRASAAKAKQAQSRIKALAKMPPIALTMEADVRPIKFSAPPKLSPPLIAVESGAVGYSDDNPILKSLNLRIDPDDRIALVGSNGNGKSTFAKMIAGRLPMMQGKMTSFPKMTVGYFAQHQLDELRPDETPFQHMADLMPNAKEPEVRAKLGAVGFSADRANNKVATLSGGEKARLLFAIIGFNAPAILILDEPTNHLDIDSRDSLIRAITEYEGAVLLISHDRHLLEACADQVWLVKDGAVKVFDGDLDDYEDLVLGRVKPGAGQKSGGNARRDKEEKASQNAEARLAKLQKDKIALDKKLSDQTLYTGDNAANNRLGQLQRREAELLRQIAEAEEEWMSAQNALEQAAE
ncbi:ABC-F family ATP-binding cassette domain-containing protein [Govanella unica]|uniref:ABC-F family ATP-binding cassette domain-containing protein n=1 Tax=Govanella unica TaxID=2975056 RepID=A0A9X3TYY0_9PROT|nr:ABC-F family ATP-binding cassette domain-containing protein [Govania unica]MDA5194368.1 ABC-F family ATP-binding cassette domain-containing protein [Govania unica]